MQASATVDLADIDRTGDRSAASHSATPTRLRQQHIADRDPVRSTSPPPPTPAEHRRFFRPDDPRSPESESPSPPSARTPPRSVPNPRQARLPHCQAESWSDPGALASKSSRELPDRMRGKTPTRRCRRASALGDVDELLGMLSTSMSTSWTWTMEGRSTFKTPPLCASPSHGPAADTVNEDREVPEARRTEQIDVNNPRRSRCRLQIRHPLVDSPGEAEVEADARAT
jgi:hypothetical protein